MTHDPLCTWRQAEEADAGDPRRWLAGGLAVCDCDKIAKVRDDMLARCIPPATAAQMEREADKRGYERGYLASSLQSLTIAALEATGMDDPRYAKGYAAGQRDMLAKCIAAVKAECYHDDPTEWCVFAAALEALQEKP